MGQTKNSKMIELVSVILNKHVPSILIRRQRFSHWIFKNEIVAVYKTQRQDIATDKG